MHPLTVAAVALAVLFFASWLVSIPLRNVSIIDIVWGLAFVTSSVAALLSAPEIRVRHVVTTMLVVVWGVRLTVHPALRNHGAGEDFRYAAMRRRIGPTFWWKSLARVFLVQAIAAWLVSLPVMLAASDSSDDAFDLLVVIGASVWLVGFAFESIGDLQLVRFKANPHNQGAVLQHGLWRYTRHPNYFGDSIVWWGIFITSVARPRGWFGLVGPLLMTFLLVRVSGVALLEKSLHKRKPEYAAYVARTAAFVPRRPRSTP